MKKLILTFGFLLIKDCILAQGNAKAWEDSIIATSSSKVITGAEGVPLKEDESHEWFTSYSISNDTIDRYTIIRNEIVSKQCVNTGKQIASVITYYIRPKKTEENETD